MAHDLPLLVQRPRTAPELAAMLHRVTAPPVGQGEAGGLADALIQIAARFGERVIESINDAPRQHLDALTDMLGVPPRPAVAAHGVVAIRPATGGHGAVLLPIHAQLAGIATDGGEPPLFETLADLDVLRLALVRAVFAQAGHTRLAEMDEIVVGDGTAGSVAARLAPAEGALLIAPGAGSLPSNLRALHIRVELDRAAPPARLMWSVATPEGRVPLRVLSDTTGGLACSGTVVLAAPSAWPTTRIAQTEAHWLALAPDPASLPAAPHGRPARITALAIGGVAETEAQPAVLICHAGMPLDATADFFPFGERPRFGSLFQILSPLLSESGAQVELRIALTNPVAAAQSPIPPVDPEGQPVIAWELATATGFRRLAPLDGTAALTRDGTVAFSVPDDAAPTTIAGQQGVWLRARLLSGHYGRDPVAAGSPITLPRAPAIRALTIRSRKESAFLPPARLVVATAMEDLPVDPTIPAPLDPLPVADVAGAALYLGLAGVGGRAPWSEATAGRTVALHLRPVPPATPIALGFPPASAATPRWQALTGNGWRDAAVRDGTDGLARSGIVRLTLPADMTPWPRNRFDPPGTPLAWLRILWPGEVDAPPAALAINAVAVRQSQRLTGEVVGSSTGRGGQCARALRTPIIGSVALEVREGGAWVTWHEVDSLAAAASDARVFTLDRASGEIGFGDGRNGWIPPAGANNLRLAQYHRGGGRPGNQPRDATMQLRSAQPGIAGVAPLEPASGGSDADEPEVARQHASAWLRHRDRAIGCDDFADLALRASPQVARAFCLGSGDAVEEERAADDMPVVTLVIIPDSADAQPQPGAELLAAVMAYLEGRRPPFGRLLVTGPRYTPVDVDLVVVAQAGRSPNGLSDLCRARVAAFLHPLTGGSGGAGWRPGERPHHSDLQALLVDTDGLVAITRLRLSLAAAPLHGPLLVCAGMMTIRVGEAG